MTLNKPSETINQNIADIKKVRRRIVDWLFKYATDEEVYEIARFYNIKTD